MLLVSRLIPEDEGMLETVDLHRTYQAVRVDGDWSTTVMATARVAALAFMPPRIDVQKRLRRRMADAQVGAAKGGAGSVLRTQAVEKRSRRLRQLPLAGFAVTRTSHSRPPGRFRLPSQVTA